ncbi:MAG: pyridoxamine 5'-phosphate oxidase [Bacteroidales bacterium]
MNRDLQHVRRDYLKQSLDPSGVPPDPFDLLQTWLADADRPDIPDHTAMHLSTVGRDGHPSSRIVLLKEIWDGKLVFYTHHQSRKGKEMARNRQVALLFFWPALERQVRVEGRVTQVPEEKSDAYFQSRPYESRIAAWASAQSRPLRNRGELEEAVSRYKTMHPEGSPVPRPPSWGGYAVSPDRLEFWQGGAARLHDRVEYLRTDSRWTRRRLAP